MNVHQLRMNYQYVKEYINVEMDFKKFPIEKNVMMVIKILMMVVPLLAEFKEDLDAEQFLKPLVSAILFLIMVGTMEETMEETTEIISQKLFQMLNIVEMEKFKLENNVMMAT